MTSGDGPRPHRPALFADLTEMIDAAGGDASPSARAEIAAATAAVVVQAGRSPGSAALSDDRFVALADTVGLDTLAALWRDSDPVSLPGALWTIYVLRQWCQSDAESVTRLWRAGEPLAHADAVVAGLPDYTDADGVRTFADTMLAGIYRGDLAVALERAAAFFRVVATGRRSVPVSAEGADGGDGAALAERNDRAAASLAAAARQWRRGTLH